MRAVTCTWLVGVLATALGWGCGQGVSTQQCTPGTAQACACVDGASGAQSCNSLGTGFDTCVCQGSASGDASSGGSEGTTEVAGRAPVGEFSAVAPGGDTLCARGGPFHFFVHGGDPRRVVIDFEGGETTFLGVCWDSWSCTIGGQLGGQPIFKDSVESLDDFEAAREAGQLAGIYDVDHPDNPFGGWTIVRVPLCSGDLFWGDATIDYGPDLTIHHRGFRNGQAVMAWLQTHYPEIEEVVFTGTSIGGYGVMLQVPTVMETYADARVTVLVDSAVGIITQSFFADAFPMWNSLDLLPDELMTASRQNLEDLRMEDFYVALANTHPSIRVAQYTSAHDGVQAAYYDMMGGDGEAWHDLAMASLSQVRGLAANFRYYLAPGPISAIHAHDVMYSREVNGVPYHAWVSELVGGESLPFDVICEGDCRADPLCTACAEGEAEGAHCAACEGWEP